MFRNSRVEKAAIELGENLKRKRLLRNITIKEMTNMLSLSESTIKRIEKGDSRVSMDSWLRYIMVMIGLKEFVSLSQIHPKTIDDDLSWLSTRKRASTKK